MISTYKTMLIKHKQQYLLFSDVILFHIFTQVCYLNANFAVINLKLTTILFIFIYFQWFNHRIYVKLQIYYRRKCIKS